MITATESAHTLLKDINMDSELLQDEISKIGISFVSHWHHHEDIEHMHSILAVLKDICSNLKEFIGIQPKTEYLEQLRVILQQLEEQIIGRIVFNSANNMLVFETEDEATEKRLFIFLNNIINNLKFISGRILQEMPKNNKAQFWLKIEQSEIKSMIGRFLPVEKPVVTIGRSNESDIVIPDPRVSGSHAELSSVNGNFVIKDLGSSNGTNISRLDKGVHLGWERVTSTLVRPGDYLSFGSTIAALTDEFHEDETLEIIEIVHEAEKGTSKGSPDKMIAVISDVHANIEALQVVLDDIKKRGIKRVFCCGDIVGYGPNPIECLKMFNGIACVKGNHDVACIDNTAEEMGFNQYAAVTSAWTYNELRTKSPDSIQYLKSLPLRNNLSLNSVSCIFFHGTPSEREGDNCYEGYVMDTFIAKDIFDDNKLMFEEFPVTFIGHSHQPLIFFMSKGSDNVSKLDFPRGGIMPLYPGLCNYIINAGSVGQPRDNDLRACYIILDASDTKNPTVEMVRLDYPFKETQKKIKEIYKEQDNGKEFVQTIYYHVGYRLELGR